MTERNPGPKADPMLLAEGHIPAPREHRGGALTGFVTADTRGQRLVLGETDDRDDMTVSGRWIAAEHPVEIRQ